MIVSIITTSETLENRSVSPHSVHLCFTHSHHESDLVVMISRGFLTAVHCLSEQTSVTQLNDLF